jgi:hypothetical protein
MNGDADCSQRELTSDIQLNADGGADQNISHDTNPNHRKISSGKPDDADFGRGEPFTLGYLDAEGVDQSKSGDGPVLSGKCRYHLIICNAYDAGAALEELGSQEDQGPNTISANERQRKGKEPAQQIGMNGEAASGSRSFLPIRINNDSAISFWGNDFDQFVDRREERESAKRKEPSTPNAVPVTKRLRKDAPSASVASSSRRRLQSTTLSISSLLEDVPITTPKRLADVRKTNIGRSM